MERQTDDKIAVPITRETRERFPELYSMSFDQGFYSPVNKERLSEILDQVILPKKGKLSQSEEAREHGEEFVTARRKHSAVESGINALKQHGLTDAQTMGSSVSNAMLPCLCYQGISKFLVI